MTDDVPAVHFAPARGARIAYQDFGAGPPTMVAIPPTAQNVEVAWERAEIRAMLERFASFCRFVPFDKRGTGASDRRGRVADVDERVDDLRAVMDHAGIEHAFLFGASEGAAMTLLFAATYPDRVDGVVLFGGGYRQYLPIADEAALAERRASLRRYAQLWGTPDSPVARGFAPSLADDPTFVTWHQRYERLSASTDALLDVLELSTSVDVGDVLGDVRAPVLALHRTGDRVVDVERSREVVARVPDGRLVELPGEDHFGYAGDVDAWMDEVERFVTGTVRSRAVAARLPARVQVRVLGRFAVEVDGEEVPERAWGSRRARTLLKRLAVARGWPVTRDALFDLLWPDEHDRAVLGPRLSVQLSAVRRVLGGGVAATRDSVRLDLDEIDVDLEALFGDDDAAVVAAWTGELLPDDVHEPWTSGVREEARARVVAAARRRAEAAVGTGDAARAEDHARLLLRLDPHDEGAHRLLVVALLHRGEADLAARAHERWTAANAELGLPPPPALDAHREVAARVERES